MKILLISSNTTISPYPVYPIGLSIISGALTVAGHDVRHFDCLVENSSLDPIARGVKEYAPDLIGISIRNIDNVNLMNEQYYIDNVKEIVRTIRTVSDSRIVLGGAGFSLIPGLILQTTGADYGIVGEGEILMVEFANNAARGIYPKENLIGPGELLSGSRIMSPSYDDKLIQYYLQSGNIASVQTKRGCTHKCIYCSYPILEGPKIRMRDPAVVIDEIEAFSNKHGSTIFFVDSVFNDAEGVYIELLKEMIRRKVNVPWTGFFTPMGLNDEIVGMMKETGLVSVEIGSDAACDTTLKKLGKGFTFRDITECNDIFAKHEIATAHYFMFGGPGENRDTVMEGIENIKNIKKCVAFILMGIRILPDTPLARIAIREKVIADDRSMLEPVYYISPGLDKDWLKKTLTEECSKVRNCIFPPDLYDDKIRLLHKLGYSGTLWDLLIPDRQRPAGSRNAAK